MQGRTVVSIPFGTSKAQKFQLVDLPDGTPLNGSGLDVDLEITDLDEAPLTVTEPTVSWDDQAAGIVAVEGCEALPVGGYLVRYKLTDGFGKIAFVPGGDVRGDYADIWQVVKIPNRRRG